MKIQSKQLLYVYVSNHLLYVELEKNRDGDKKNSFNLDSTQTPKKPTKLKTKTCKNRSHIASEETLHPRSDEREGGGIKYLSGNGKYAFSFPSWVRKKLQTSRE